MSETTVVSPGQWSARAGACSESTIGYLPTESIRAVELGTPEEPDAIFCTHNRLAARFACVFSSDEADGRFQRATWFVPRRRAGAFVRLILQSRAPVN